MTSDSKETTNIIETVFAYLLFLYPNGNLAVIVDVIFQELFMFRVLLAIFNRYFKYTCYHIW